MFTPSTKVNLRAYPSQQLAFMMNLLVFVELALLLFCQGSFASTAFQFPGKPSRLITSQERIDLLKMIKAGKDQEIKAFFKDKDNWNIDFPLITFKSTDDPQDGDGIHGFTPLSAAIFYCKPEVFEVLFPLQYSTKWTTFAAPGYSHVELAAKHCPELIDDWFCPDMFNGLDFNQLFNLFILTKESEQENKGHIINLIKENLIGNLDLFISFIDVWIENFEEMKPPPFHEIWRGSHGIIVPLLFNDNFLREAAIKLIKAGHVKEFQEIWEHFGETREADDLLIKAGRHLSPDHFSGTFRFYFDIKIMTDLQIISEKASKYSNNLADYITNGIELIISLHKSLESVINIGTTQRITRKYLPFFYGSIVENYPRLDLIVMVFGDKYNIVSTGNYKKIPDTYENGIMRAFHSDDPVSLKEELQIIDSLDKISYNSLNLRFNFNHYTLSLIKAAVALQKPNIMQFLMTQTDNKESLNSSTKFALTALEMAACYWPDFLVEHIVPLIGMNCKERMKAANNLIAMFTETKIKKCPTGAKNAQKVLKALLTSTEPNEIKCIDLDVKDYIRESIKLRYPSEIIEAFWEIGHYTDINAYIELSIVRNNYRLLKYFVSKLNDGYESVVLKFGLVRWIRLTDGLPTTTNINFFEFFLAHPGTDINAHDPETGSTALSLAIKNNHLWIVKRLLLLKDLDVNLADLDTKRTPLHHAINQCNSVHNDMLPEQQTYSQLSNKKQKTIILKQVFKELSLPPIPQLFEDTIVNILSEIMQNFIIFVQLQMMNEKEIHGMFVNWIATYFTEKCSGSYNLKEKVRVSPHNGFLHNVLLSHPDIDTSLKDAGYFDSMRLIKKRALIFGGNTPALKELGRAHFRIMKIDATKEDKQSKWTLALVAISTIIIGSASFGIVRWMT